METLLLVTFIAGGMVLFASGLASVLGKAPTQTSSASGLIMALTPREQVHWATLGTLAFLVLGLTLPSKPPFAPGAAFGPGFFVAVGLWMFTAWMHRRENQNTPVPYMWAGVLASLVPGLFWATASVPAALMGVASGLATATLLLCLAEEDRPLWSRALQRGALFGIAVTAAALLGLLRPGLTAATSPQDPTLWHNCALVLGILTAVAATVGYALVPRLGAVSGFLARLSSVLWDEDAPGRAAAVVVSIAVALLGGATLALNYLQEPLLALVFGLGIMSGLLILTLSRDSATDTNSALRTPFAMLVALGAFMAGFGLLQGYGAAVALVGASLPVVLAPGERSLPALRVLLFGLGLVVYRLFATRYGDLLRGVSLADNYALFATIVGLLLPQIPALWSRNGNQTALPRTWGSGLVALVAPATLILFYGGKVGPSLMVGLALSALLRGTRMLAWWSLTMAFAVLEATRHLLPLAELTRDQRLQLLVMVAGSTALVLVVADFTARRQRQ